MERKEMDRTPPLDLPHVGEIDPSWMDIKVGWKLYKENKKSLIGFSLFTLFGTLLITMIFGIALLVLIASIYNAMGESFPMTAIVYFSTVFSLMNSFIMFSLIGCIYGLAYDIMSSGDEFTEIKSAFIYFRRRGVQYVVIILISGAVNLIPSFLITSDWFIGLFSSDPNGVALFFGLIAFLQVIGYFWGALFIAAMPAVTYHGEVRRALSESVQIFKTHKKRVLKTTFFFFAIFSLPMSFVLYYYYQAINTGSEYAVLVGLLVILACSVIALTVGSPIQVLCATRIYNTCLPDAFKKERAPVKEHLKIERRF